MSHIHFFIYSMTHLANIGCEVNLCNCMRLSAIKNQRGITQVASRFHIAFLKGHLHCLEYKWHFLFHKIIFIGYYVSK